MVEAIAAVAAAAGGVAGWEAAAWGVAAWEAAAWMGWVRTWESQEEELEA